MRSAPCARASPGFPCPRPNTRIQTCTPTSIWPVGPALGVISFLHKPPCVPFFSLNLLAHGLPELRRHQWPKCPSRQNWPGMPGAHTGHGPALLLFHAFLLLRLQAPSGQSLTLELALSLPPTNLCLPSLLVEETEVMTKMQVKEPQNLRFVRGTPYPLFQKRYLSQSPQEAL